MSELAREIIPIAVMYVFVLALAPFIGFAMYVAFDGDRLREEERDLLEVDTQEAVVEQITPEAREALGAA